jgi:hypothetical protein
MSLGGLGEANVGGVWVPSLRYLPVEAQEPNFEINLVEMTVKLERRMDQYERTRLVTLELETDLDPDTLFDRVNCLNTATLYSKSGQLLGEVLRVKDDPLEVSA